MQITKISFSKTVESNVMGAGIWTKVSVEGQVGENENVQSAIEQAKAEVEVALNNSVPAVDTYFNPVKSVKQSTKITPDGEIRKQYAVAVASMNKEKVEQLEAIYNFQIG